MVIIILIVGGAMVGDIAIGQESVSGRGLGGRKYEHDDAGDQ